MFKKNDLYIMHVLFEAFTIEFTHSGCEQIRSRSELYDKRWMRNSDTVFFGKCFLFKTIFCSIQEHTQNSHTHFVNVRCVKRGAKYLQSNVETIWKEQTKINHPVKYSNSFRLVGHRENNV